MNTAQTTKNLAKTIAKQMAQEPLEILKDVKEQVVGNESPPQTSQPPAPNEVSPQEKLQKEMNDKMKSGRRMEALDRELKDISKENLFKELQQKISEGQEVYVDEYSELSMEQKQVLKAQQEAVKMQIAQQQNSQNSLVEPGAKKGRKLFGFGQKKAAQEQTTRVEKPVPPSG